MSFEILDAKHNENFKLVDFFEEFLSFWSIQREQIEKHYNKGLNLISNDNESIEDIPRFLHSKLIAFAKYQDEKVKRIALPHQQINYKKLVYAISAYIDEQLLEHVKWTGQEEWLPLMLELHIFGSRNSGENLIKKFENLATKEGDLNNDEQNLAICYLKIFWLGFDGKYRNNPIRLEKLTKTLTSRSEFYINALSNSPLFPQAYQHNVNPKSQSRLAPISKWRKIIIFSLFLYLLISWTIWFFSTHELAQLLDKLGANSVF